MEALAQERGVDLNEAGAEVLTKGAAA